MVSTEVSKTFSSGSNPDIPTMKFKYDNKIYETPNLEKKLKRMKLTLDDIELIEETPTQEIPKQYGIDGKEVRYFLHPNGIKTLCYIPIGENPTAKEWFKDVMWNGSTGIKWCIPEYLKTLILV